MRIRILLHIGPYPFGCASSRYARYTATRSTSPCGLSPLRGVCGEERSVTSRATWLRSVARRSFRHSVHSQGSEPKAEPHEIENNWPKDRMFTRVVPRLVGLVHFPRASTFVSSLTILSEPEAFGRSEWSEEGKEMNVTSPLLWSVRMSVGLVNASNLHLTSVAERVAREQNDQRRDRYATPYTLPPAPFLGSLRPFGWRSLPTLAYGGAQPKERR